MPSGPAAGSLRVRLVVLGGLRIEGGSGTEVTLRGRRAEVVFAYLAVEHARVVSREELADALWPDRLPDTWASALRGVVSEVRRFLDDAGFASASVLAGVGAGWQLRLPATAVVDLDEARAALARARSSRTNQDHADSVAAAERALALVTLPFLPDHDSEWVETVRSELRDIHLAALEIAAREHANSGDGRAAASIADRLVRVNPYDEASHQLLISLLGDLGDHAGATRAYQRCELLLNEELGLEPSPATKEALERALATHSVPASTRTETPVRAADGYARYSVLVVEDHEFQRRFAVTLLRRIGVSTVFEAADGEEALELLTRIPPPDILMCDLDMPRMDGVQLIRTVAENALANAIGITSGLDREILETVRGLAEGYGVQVLGVIEKPLTVSGVKRLLSSYRPPVVPADCVVLSLEDIEAGLATGQVWPHAAPIADLATGRIVAAEAVPMWLDPDSNSWKRVTPAVLPGQGDTAQCSYLLHVGCVAAARLARTSMDVQVVIRIPNTRFSDTSLADRLEELAGINHLPHPRLVVAVDGATFTLTTRELMARVRVKGFGAWLDDATTDARWEGAPFTGVRFLTETLRATLNDADGSRQTREEFQRARARGVVVVGAECTEAQHVSTLVELGAQLAQGEFIAPPMPLADLADWAENWDPATLVTEGA